MNIFLAFNYFIQILSRFSFWALGVPLIVGLWGLGLGLGLVLGLGLRLGLGSALGFVLPGKVL